MDEVVLDLDSLTIREIKMVETKTGKSFTKIGELLQTGSEPVGDILQVFAYLIRKRTDPTFTYDAAEDLVVRFDTADPTNAPT